MTPGPVSWAGPGGRLSSLTPGSPSLPAVITLTVGAVPFEVVITAAAEGETFTAHADRTLMKAALMAPGVPFGTSGAARFGRLAGTPHLHAVFGARAVAIPLRLAAGFTGAADLAEFRVRWDAEAAVDSWLAEVQP